MLVMVRHLGTAATATTREAEELLVGVGLVLYAAVLVARLALNAAAAAATAAHAGGWQQGGLAQVGAVHGGGTLRGGCVHLVARVTCGGLR